MEENREMQGKFSGLGEHIMPGVFAVALGAGFVALFALSDIVEGWWVYFGLVIFGLMVVAGALMLVEVMKDIRSGQTTLTGRIDRMRIGEVTRGTSVFIWQAKVLYFAINGREFQVSSRLSNWLHQGDEVVVHYWPRTKAVAKIEKVSNTSNAI